MIPKTRLGYRNSKYADVKSTATVELFLDFLWYVFQNLIKQDQIFKLIFLVVSFALLFSPYSTKIFLVLNNEVLPKYGEKVSSIAFVGRVFTLENNIYKDCRIILSF
jgi:hypothetical protein